MHDWIGLRLRLDVAEESKALNSHLLRAAYFSMGIALKADIPTYAGGLGNLAGDTLRFAADIGLPVAGITLLHRKGYFDKHLDEHGNQSATPCVWNPEAVLEPTDTKVSIVFAIEEMRRT